MSEPIYQFLLRALFERPDDCDVRAQVQEALKTKSDAGNWKRDFLSLSALIEAFEARRLETIETNPPSNVSRLLKEHLSYSRELLWAEVNGGLDEHYQTEVDALDLAKDRKPAE